MLKLIRKYIVHRLLNQYRKNSAQLQSIEFELAKKGVTPLYFDHFAMIDLPGPHTGIPVLIQLFELLGFNIQGRGYLPDKQNDFVWLCENDHSDQLAHEVLPQAVVADFRLYELPVNIRGIIKKYAKQAQPLPLDSLKHWINQINSPADNSLMVQVVETVCHYLNGRDWPLPTLSEFLQVWEFNQLLAWVLVFGRKPNHFTLSIHLLNYFVDLPSFHSFLQHELALTLNTAGGLIKGGPTAGLAQSATVGALEIILLADGSIILPTAFIEFVWRYPHSPSLSPRLWKDFFNGFLATHATHVIQSLAST